MGVERNTGTTVRTRALEYLLGEQPTKRSVERERRYVLGKKINIIEVYSLITTDNAAVEPGLLRY